MKIEDYLSNPNGRYLSRHTYLLPSHSTNYQPIPTAPCTTGSEENSNRQPLTNQTAETDSLITDLFQNKEDIILKKITMLLAQLGDREEILRENLEKIENDICQCHNVKFGLEAMGLGTSQEARDIEFNRVLDLERQKRQERTSHFKDLVFLKKEFMDSLLEFFKLKQREDFIGGIDHPQVQ